VDWYSFWLKNEEDPEPNKAQQYERWRKLQRAMTMFQPWNLSTDVNPSTHAVLQ
jgi:hypothetical protein